MIIRNRARRQYTCIPNAIINHESLPPLAKMAIIYILSKPDDWQVRKHDLQTYLQVSKNVMCDLLRDIRQAGYCQLVKCRDSSGQINGSEYHFYDTPVTGSPLTGSPAEPTPGEMGSIQSTEGLPSTELSKRVSSSLRSEETSHQKSDEKQEPLPVEQPPEHEPSEAVDVQTPKVRAKKPKTRPSATLDLQRRFYGAWQRRFREQHGFTPAYHIKNRAACGRMIGRLSKYLKDSPRPFQAPRNMSSASSRSASASLARTWFTMAEAAATKPNTIRKAIR